MSTAPKVRDSAVISALSHVLLPDTPTCCDVPHVLLSRRKGLPKFGHMSARNNPLPDEPVEFSVDLTGHEMTRRVHVMAALGADWDPAEAMRGEEEAYDMLYSGLDAEQQRLYDTLVSAGVLPRRGGGRASA